MKQLNFFTTTLLILIVFLGLITIIFNISGLKFYLEMIVLIALLFFGLIAMALIYNKINFGYVIYSIVSAIALLNFILIFYRIRIMSTIMFVSIIAAMTAFVLGVVNIGKKRAIVHVEPYHEPPKKIAVKKTSKKASTKYISTKTGKTYHKPSCIFAKRIRKDNRLNYTSLNQVKRKKLKPHTCI